MRRYIKIRDEQGESVEVLDHSSAARVPQQVPFAELGQANRVGHYRRVVSTIVSEKFQKAPCEDHCLENYLGAELHSEKRVPKGLRTTRRLNKKATIAAL